MSLRTKVITVVGLGVLVAVSTILQAVQSAQGGVEPWRPYILFGAVLTGAVTAWQLVANIMLSREQHASAQQPAAPHGDPAPHEKPGGATPPVAQPPAGRTRLLTLTASMALIIAVVSVLLQLTADGSEQRTPPDRADGPPSPSDASAGAARSPSPSALPLLNSPEPGKTPQPTGTGGNNHQPTTAPPQYTGSIDVQRGTYIEWDGDLPSTQGAGGATPAAVDVQIGPDNAYPENGARIWRTDSPDTCAAQAAANGTKGLQEQIVLSQILESSPSVNICMVTSGRRAGVMTISSINNTAYAPYRIQYRF